MTVTPYSYREYTGNGSNKNFQVPFPYLLKAHVKVYSGLSLATGTYTSLLVDGVDYAWTSATNVQLTVAPAVGIKITVKRETPTDDLLTQWQDGSTLVAEDLLTSDKQNLYAVQEEQDLLDVGVALSVSASSAATAATAAANTATSTANTALTTANAASATAATSLSTSQTALANSQTAVNNAASAVTTSQTAASNAATALSTSQTASTNAATAVSTSNTAATNAATALSTANTSLTNSQTASQNAATALTNSQTSLTQSAAAVTTANNSNATAASASSVAASASTAAASATTTANTANSKADQAIAAVSSSINYTLIANVAAIPASPANNTYIEIGNSTGIESFTPLTGRPAGFVGDSGLTVRLVYTTAGTTWNWLSYFPNNAETRYLKLGSTGTVTSAMIADGAVVNADVSATAAIAGTKIAPDFGSQNRTSTGTSTAASFIPTSSTVPTNGLYLPSAGSVAISTNGTGRLFVDSSGRVGIGVSPTERLDVAGVINSSSAIYWNNGTGKLQFSGSDIYVDSTGASVFRTGGANERLRITGSGLVGIGTSSPGSLLNLYASSASQTELRIGNGNSTAGGRIGFRHGVGQSELGYISNTYTDFGGGIVWHTRIGSQNSISFATGGIDGAGETERLRISSSGNVGIGTSSPECILSVEKNSAVNFTSNANLRSTASLTLGNSDQATTAIAFKSATGNWDKFISWENLGGTQAFSVGYLNGGNTRLDLLRLTNLGEAIFARPAGESARIDQQGRLLVGTSTNSYTSSKLEVSGGFIASSEVASRTYTLFNVSSANPTTVNGSGFNSVPVRVGDVIAFPFGQSRTVTAVVSDTQLTVDSAWTTSFAGVNVTGYPSLVFSTTADGASSPTERMRLGSDSALRLASSTFILCPYAYATTSASAANVIVGSDGNFFRSTSSAKYKTDIETLQDQFADVILDCRPVWYRSTCEKDNPTWGYWGLIAEEVAEVDPRLVFWKTHETVAGKDGNETTMELDQPIAEGVQYDRFVPHLLNLIKRQKEQIEVMEARLSALEAQ